MKQCWLIARRDLNAIVLSPTGLFLLGIYLVIAGYLFSTYLVSTQEASLEHAFAALGRLTLVIAPLITMRLIAEEIRTGTFEVLVSNPVLDWQIVFGKFTAGWLAFTLYSLPTISYLLVLQAVGSPDWLMAISGYLGQLFLASAVIALGLLLSTLTDNQMLAAMSAMVLAMLLASAGEATYILHGEVGEALAYLSLMDHFTLFRRGILDSRSIFFFLLTTAMLLFLGIRMIESRRWNVGVVPGTVPTGWEKPRLSLFLIVLSFVLLSEGGISRYSRGFWGWYGGGLVVAGFAGIAISGWLNRRRLRYELGRRQTGVAFTVFANCCLVVAVWSMLLFLTSKYFTRFDLTSGQRHAISPLTRSILSQIHNPVDIVVTMTSPTDLVQQTRDVLDEMASLSPSLAIHYIDPRRSPAEIESWNAKYDLVSPLSDEILVAYGGRYRRIPRSALTYSMVIQMVQGRRIFAPVHFVGEAEIVSALLYVTQEQPGRVVFLSGHGEKDPEDSGDQGYSRAVHELHLNSWTVQHHIVTPGALTQFPPDTGVVVVAGPKRPLSNEDIRAINEVLDRGGGVFLLLDPGASTGVEPLIHPWDVRIGDDLVVDLKSYTADSDAASIYVRRFTSNHPIAKGMGDLSAVFFGARRIAINTNNPNPTVSAVNFIHTTGDGWAIQYKERQSTEIDPSKDRRGPISLGMAIERFQLHPDPGRPPLQGRMVVIGDSDFASNRFIDLAGNRDLFANCIEWLAGRHQLIAIRPAMSDLRKVAITSRQMKIIYWWSLIVLPGLSLAGGVLLYARRRHST